MQGKGVDRIQRTQSNDRLADEARPGKGMCRACHYKGL